MALKNKLMAFFRGKRLDFLSQRVTFYKSRVDLFGDFEAEHVKDINDAAARKISRRIAKNTRLLAAYSYDVADQRALFHAHSETALDVYRKKLRMAYRVEREKTRRQIAKLSNKPESKSQIAKLEAYIAKCEQDIEEKVEVFKAHRHIRLEKTLEKRQGVVKPDEAHINAIKARAECDNNSYTESVEKARDEKVTHFVNKNRHRVAHMTRRLTKYETKLAAVLAQQTTNEITLPEDVILRAEHLCMFFGGVKAVNDLTFDVKKGEIFGLIGPNGAGKTTVFNCITQFYKPTSGKLLFRNRLGETVNLNKLAVHNVILQGIVRTFQNLEVVKEVSVLDNLLIAAHRQYQSNFIEHMLHLPILTLEEKVIRARADKVLAFMGLSQYRDWLVWGLPYGVLKKIEIARTLMANPHLIILDEPAAGLNDSETVELATLIRRIRDEYNCTILLVEHDMGLVMDVCDNILAISFGKKLAIGTAKEIQSNKDVQAAYLGAPEEEKQ